MGLKKLGFELLPGTGWETAWAAAPAALAGFQAASAQRQLGKVRTDIDNYRRQDIENPFANLSNPYENLAVATQAAEIKMEQTDQALANTLDTLRETGAAAGGATAIANAALKSKQGVSASIEKQEAQNQMLQAQGQLQVDIYKGKGEDARIQRQENRDVNELNRLQSQADTAQFTRNQAIDTGIASLGSAGQTLAGGLVPNQIPDQQSQTPVDTNNLGLNNNNSQSLNALNPIPQNLPNYSSVQTVGQANNIMQTNQGPQTPVSSVPVASVSGVLPSGFDMTKRLLDPDDEIAFGLTWDTALNKYTQ